MTDRYDPPEHKIEEVIAKTGGDSPIWQAAPPPWARGGAINPETRGKSNV